MSEIEKKLDNNNLEKLDFQNSKQIKFNAIAGGGDTISAIKSSKTEDGFNYISNAGGAFLEWLEGKELPGIKALN